MLEKDERRVEHVMSPSCCVIHASKVSWNASVMGTRSMHSPYTSSRGCIELRGFRSCQLMKHCRFGFSRVSKYRVTRKGS